MIMQCGYTANYLVHLSWFIIGIKLTALNNYVMMIEQSSGNHGNEVDLLHQNITKFIYLDYSLVMILHHNSPQNYGQSDVNQVFFAFLPPT